MKIKFNPFNAQTILFALLLALECRSEKKEFEFVASSDEDLPASPLKWFKGKKEAVAKSEGKMVLPVNSPYRNSSLPYFFYLSSEANTWKAKESQSAAAGLVLKVMQDGMDAVFKAIAYEANNTVSKSFFNELKSLGGAAHEMVEVMQDKELTELFMKKKTSFDARKKALVEIEKVKKEMEAEEKKQAEEKKKAEAKAKYEKEQGELEAARLLKIKQEEEAAAKAAAEAKAKK